MKMAEIQYKKIGDKIVIVGFKNVLNRGELVKHLGEDSYFKYIYSSPLFYQKQDSIIIKTLKDSTVKIFHIRPGDILTSSDFDEIIKEMKKAGSRLMQIRKEAEEEIKTVKI
jgi:hypothetical protein